MSKRFEMVTEGGMVYEVGKHGSERIRLVDVLNEIHDRIAALESKRDDDESYQREQNEQR